MPAIPETQTVQHLGLRTCLAAQSRRLLAAIARANGWPFDTGRPKASSVEKLTQRLASAGRLDTILVGLAPDAKAALRVLLMVGGQMAQGDFIYRFGVLRSYRPWREDSPVAPWETPVSPTEVLFYRGLVFPINLGTRDRPQPAIVLPLEYHAILSNLLSLPQFPPSPSPYSSPTSSPSLLLLSDLFTWLSFLNRETVRPLHGRWLPPSALRALSAWFEIDEMSVPLRSERKWPYPAFLHYLAERAGLVGITSGALKPTAESLAWLETPEPARWQALWDAWSAQTQDNARLWTRYHLPLAAEDDPPARFGQLCDALQSLLSGSPLPQQTLSGLLQMQAPALFRPDTAYQNWADLDSEAQAAYRDVMLKAVDALLTGPLAWFGIVRVVDEGVILTTAGAALWGREGGIWPPVTSAPGLVVRVESDPKIAAPALWLHAVAQPLEGATGLSPVQRLHLERFAPPDPDTPDAYRLEAATVISAYQQGYTVEGLLTLLEAAVGPLPPLLVGTLYRWAETLTQVQVRQIIVLETRDPALLQALTRERRIRELVMETLSARAVRVDGAHLDALLRRLARQGVTPVLDVPARTNSPLVQTTATKVASEERVTIAAALRVYAQLADALGAPVRAPHTLARGWMQGLEAAQRDTVERLTDTVLTMLRRASLPETDYHVPEPTGPLLQALERAIAAGATLDIVYYTAGRDHVTRRRIDPLRLEWHGDVVYLIAYCHLRQDQRVFRVERMEVVEE
ncbi:MAG: helix-turn-helix transcriptional regulator [Anaerolineae bacterium]